jgi:GTP 3',8-cyclase
MTDHKPCYSLDRCRLAERIPLSTPFAITLTPSTKCIFKCCYCPQSIAGTPFIKQNMDWDTFTKIIGQVQEFDEKLKAIHFQGMGEPLIHPLLPDMIKYCKERGVAERLNLITNGVLLTEKLSLSLIDAGLDTIKISLQGITPEKYYETSGVKINFERLTDNIRFLYHHKQDCELFVKIADISLGKGDVGRFYKLFNPISDRANIEYIRPMYEGIDYEQRHIGKNPQVNVYAENHQTFEVCSFGFFMMYINPQGDAYPCCNYRDPAGWGNIHKKTLKKIWDSMERQEFLEMMMSHERNNQGEYPICNGCNMPDAMLRVEDSLDEL